MRAFASMCLVSLVLYGSAVLAQGTADSIHLVKKFGAHFQQHGKNLTMKQLMDITQVNPEAFKEMKIAKSNYDVSLVLAVIGGGLVGWPLGTAIGGGEPQWILAGIGGALIITTIPLTSAFVKHGKNAAGIYNNGLSRTGLRRVRCDFRVSGNGAGLRLLF